jgi:phosphate-selective porin OprO and OprP
MKARFTRLVALAGVMSVAGAAGRADAQVPGGAPTGITLASGVNSLTLGARMQFRWSGEQREGADADTSGPGVGREDGLLSQFDVPRMRLSLSGGAFRPWLRYLFQFDFSRTSGEGGSKIKDAMLEMRPEDWPIRLAAGQFKVPFGLQQLTSSGRQQFVDRAVTDAKFVPGRDAGVMIAGSGGGDRLGYEFGVFNGSGEGVRQSNASHLWAGRIFVEPFGAYQLAEGAAESGDRAILHVGVGARGGDPIRGRATQGVVEEAEHQSAVNVEFALRLPRFYSTVEHYWMTDENQAPASAGDVPSRGFHAQAGYALAPRRTEVALRIARVLGDTRVDDAAVTEVRGVVGYFWQSHNLKVQVDGGRLTYGANYANLSPRARSGLPALGTRLVTGASLRDHEVRAQLQLAF